jgi:SAM-dependent methyltransferase
VKAPASWEATWREAAREGAYDFDAPRLENLIDRAKLEFLAPFLPATGRAVEIGCGSARLLARIARRTALAPIAIDLAPAALGLARASAAAVGRPVACVCADALRLPLASGSCDLVLSGGLLEHFPDPTAALAEMARVLRPGGVLYADVVPRKFSLYRIREVPRMVWSPMLLPGVSESTLGPADYRRRLRALGLGEVRTRSCGVYPPWMAGAAWSATRWLDGTPLAGWLGWYFMLVARRAA